MQAHKCFVVDRFGPCSRAAVLKTTAPYETTTATLQSIRTYAYSDFPSRFTHQPAHGILRNRKSQRIEVSFSARRAFVMDHETPQVNTPRQIQANSQSISTPNIFQQSSKAAYVILIKYTRQHCCSLSHSRTRSSQTKQRNRPVRLPVRLPALTCCCEQSQPFRTPTTYTITYTI